MEAIGNYTAELYQQRLFIAELPVIYRERPEQGQRATVQLDKVSGCRQNATAWLQCTQREQLFRLAGRRLLAISQRPLRHRSGLK